MFSLINHQILSQLLFIPVGSYSVENIEGHLSKNSYADIYQYIRQCEKSNFSKKEIINKIAEQ